MQSRLEKFSDLELSLDNDEQVITVNSKDIPALIRLEARWNFFRFNEGALHRNGDITLINPDNSSQVAALYIGLDSEAHYISADDDCLPNGTSENPEYVCLRETSRATLNVKAIPVNPDGLSIISSEGNLLDGDFAELMMSSAFNVTARDGYAKAGSIFLPHRDFIKKHKGVYPGPQGIGILQLTNSKLLERGDDPIAPFRSEIALSRDANIRFAFAQFIESFLPGRDMLALKNSCSPKTSLQPPVPT